MSLLHKIKTDKLIEFLKKTPPLKENFDEHDTNILVHSIAECLRSLNHGFSFLPRPQTRFLSLAIVDQR